MNPTSTALPPREYVLLISGTMNPPHKGHVRLGLAAAERLRAAGHGVHAICFLPVHDNYLCNKVLAKQRSSESVSVADTIAFTMDKRCALLRTLMEGEPAQQTQICHVLDYEQSSGDASLLEASPGYWAPKLPDGYLKTVPTASVIAHFAAHSPLMTKDRRLGVVFGVDNLAGMVSWNAPGRLLEQADLLLLARATPRVTLGKDPTELLSALRHVEIRAAVPVVYDGKEVLGGTCGSFENTSATGDGAFFMLPPLEGDDEGLSSTSLREAIAAEVNATEPAAKRRRGSDLARGRTSASILAKHGYPESSLGQFLEVAENGEETVKAMVASGRARSGEWVAPEA